MKKIMTIAGTRPEIIRLSEIIKVLDKLSNHVFVHTWQNFTFHLHDQFFSELEIRKPDYQLNKNQLSWFAYIWMLLSEIDKIISEESPEAILILWDTNSALSAYVAKRRWIPVFHMEAWNRCYDDLVPEEVNRKIIDSLSTYLLPYTQRSREHLLTEWYHPSKIIVTWNPITEVVQKSIYQIWNREIAEEYVLVTIHRDENVTNKEKLQSILNALEEISKSYKTILSMHPKLESMLEKYNLKIDEKIETNKPFWFKKFLNLEKYAKCVLSDSWTVPEECCILQTPCVLLRTSTERPELLENNSMILSWVSKEEILNSFYTAIATSTWTIPDDYKDINVSEKIIKILFRHV